MSELKSEKELKEYMDSSNFHGIDHPGLHPEWVMETEDLHKQEDLWKIEKSIIILMIFPQ